MFSLTKTVSDFMKKILKSKKIFLPTNKNTLTHISQTRLIWKNPIIEVQQGLLRGIKEDNINGKSFFAFRAIPYAKPPVGKLRFKDPEPVETWSGIRDAIKYGNKCAQVIWINRKISGKEDCLYLNVFTTKLNPEVPRAVIVCIHGGNFVCGSGDDDIFGPDYLVEKDIVVVTLNYRVGILGFLNLDDEEASGNQGLKDLVEALKWLKQNISKFGGDPNNITLWGLSAGGASAHYLALSPLAQGLFHKVIMQSGVAINPWARAPDDMKEKAEKVSAKLRDRITDPKKLVEFLRKIDLYELIKAQESLCTWKDRMFLINHFGPSVDSKSENPFLKVPVEEAAMSGIKVPCIIGHVAHEGIYNLSEIKDENYREINDNQEELLIHPHSKKNLENLNITYKDLKQFFMDDKEISPRNIKDYLNLITAAHFVIDIQRAIKIQSQITEVPTYMYKFDFYSKKTSIMQKILRIDIEGTCHVEDLPYIFYPKWFTKFGLKPYAPDSIEFLNHQRFLDLWSNFVKTGDPTPTISKILPFKWQPIDTSTQLNCLKISKEFYMTKKPFILNQLAEKNKVNLHRKKKFRSGNLTVELPHSFLSEESD
ncbi:esterase E4-like [Cotesia glomerata]|uniref:esterase E4-like n=1 Tax=Cotesia glomerata TaxID=32391 RepID=UPI001D009B15|nr:esterase E4-like [Cotesia glomerata]